MVRITFLTAAIAALAAVPAFADTLTLENGDRLTGQVVGVEDGKLVFEMPGVGVVRPDTEAVSGLDTEAPFLAMTGSGTRAIGSLTWLGDGRVRITTDDGPIEVALADLRLLDPEADVAALAESLDEAIDVLGEEAEKSPWTLELQLGANYSSGNSDQMGMNFRTFAKRETPGDTFTGELWILYSEQDGDRAVNQQYVGFREDLKLDDQWSVFGALSLLRDEFQELDLRFILTVGVSYWVEKTKDFEFRIDLGPTLTYEDYEDQDAEYKGEGFAGFWLKWPVFDKAEISEDFRWYQDLSNWPDYRFASITSFTTPLSEAFFLKFDLIFRYNTFTRPGRERLDTQMLLSLVWKL